MTFHKSLWHKVAGANAGALLIGTALISLPLAFAAPANAFPDDCEDYVFQGSKGTTAICTGGSGFYRASAWCEDENGKRTERFGIWVDVDNPHANGNERVGSQAWCWGQERATSSGITKKN
ncbi:hypothetical protein ACFYO1_07175 [Nocardia sp. NPDC006044]|uniref:hypothetical protein n=1 Tax=Nocardia sp. NPDC006044 TaxID=3364306 RepID=UPI0036D1CD7F